MRCERRGDIGKCVKVARRPGYGDQHRRFRDAGSENDVAELVEFLQALFTVGYLKRMPGEDRPWAGIEVKSMPGESSKSVLANTKRAWIEAWARV